MRDFHLTALSESLREAYRNDLFSLIHNITIYSNTSLNEAYNLTQTQAKNFLESSEVKDWIKIKESEQKIQVGIAERLNSVISGLGVVVKAVGALAKRR